MIWLVIAACLVISFTFSGIESGVLSVNRIRLRHHALRGEQAALQLDALLMRIERLMITVVLVTNAANVLAIALIYGQLAGWLGHEWAALACIILLLPVVLLLLEFLPKAIFRRFPYRTLVVFARILTITHWILGPIVAVGAWILRPVVRKRREPRLRGLVSVESLKNVVSASVERGEVSPNEQQFIRNILDFRAVKVRDVMVPMEKVATVEPDLTVSETLDLARTTGADRFVVRDFDGNVLGILRVFDLLRDNVKMGRARSYVRRAVNVSGEQSGFEALRKLRAARMQVAIVTGPDNKPLGTVHTETLVRSMLIGATTKQK